MNKELRLEEAIEKYGKEKVRPIFQIRIRDKMYQVYSIEGYEHNLGKNNGCPDTWWLDYSDYGTEYDIDDAYINIRPLIPYIDNGVHRTCWGVEYQQYNTTKYKWDEWNLYNGGVCKITANGKEVYQFNHSDLNGALVNAQVLIEKMMNHPFNFIKPEEEIGRKIWYYGLPAKILLGHRNGEIQIEPDYTYLSSTEWWNELERRRSRITPKENAKDDDDRLNKEYFEETKDFGIINHGDVFHDGMIWWFRN